MANSSSANDKIDNTPFTYSAFVNFIDYVIANRTSPENNIARKREGIDHVDPKRVRNDDGEPVTSAGGTPSEEDTNLCVVCSKNQKNYSFLHDDCMHFCVCESCAFRIENLQRPICNIRALKVLRTYK